MVELDGWVHTYNNTFMLVERIFATFLLRCLGALLFRFFGCFAVSLFRFFDTSLYCHIVVFAFFAVSLFHYFNTLPLSLFFLIFLFRCFATYFAASLLHSLGALLCLCFAASFGGWKVREICTVMTE